MTFLDLVRELGVLTQRRCHDECDLGLHRQEAARHLGVLLENPRLVRELAAKVTTEVTTPAVTTPAEHDALAQVRGEVVGVLGDGDRFLWPSQVEDVIRALRRLVADPGKRPAVLVALGLGGEGA